jgi:YVTN family beta-propeller protein
MSLIFPGLRITAKRSSKSNRNRMKNWLTHLILLSCCFRAVAEEQTIEHLSPTALVVAPDGRTLFVACSGARQVAVFDMESKLVRAMVQMPAPPSGLAISKDSFRLFVSCAAPSSVVCVIDTSSLRITRTFPAGHTAMSPVLAPDEQRLYICNRFDNDVSVLDLSSGREVNRIRVNREPVAAAITPDGKYLLVANHLHSGPANDSHASAKLSVIDTAAGKVAKEIRLTLGAGLVKGVAISPDGRFAAVTHLRSMFWLSTTSVELGRINNNALTFIDLRRFEPFGTLLLDQSTRGAANPWAVAWMPDGKTVALTHAGTHEVSVIEVPADADEESFRSMTLGAYAGHRKHLRAPPPNPVRVRQRIALQGQGPRSIAVADQRIFVANYFSDDLCQIDLSTGEPALQHWPLRSAAEPSLARLGEMLFNDARICFQSWQSCASCHDSDARTDAFNWDLLNDGIGNPKNTKSLVWSHRTGKAMSLGVRASAEAAVRAGIHHILFTDPSPEIAEAMDTFLRSLEPIPSPHLVNGRFSVAAEGGKAIFTSASTGCATCHPPGLLTDLEAYEVGTSAPYRGYWGEPGSDGPSPKFDTPALVELWRTAPYLHNGSAANLRDLFTTHNARDQHGRTSHLTQSEIEDLVAYLLSL